MLYDLFAGAGGASGVAPSGAGSVNGGVGVVGGVNQYKSYEQNLHRLGTFDSLEGFWQHYSYINAPEELPKDHNVFLFRNTLIPGKKTNQSIHNMDINIPLCNLVHYILMCVCMYVCVCMYLALLYVLV